MSARPAPLTADQRRARGRWQARFGLPIVVAALLPLFVTSPEARWVEVGVGIGSWLVFVVDLVVQRRIVPDYLHRRAGRVDLAIVVLTFPYYLLPGADGATALLLLARLGRVARLLTAGEAPPVHAELAALREQVRAVETRPGELAERTRVQSGVGE